MGDNPDGVEFVSKCNQFIDTKGWFLNRRVLSFSSMLNR